MQAEAEGVIADLQLSTVLYCWRKLSEDEWAMVMHRANESIAAMAVAFEDQVWQAAEVVRSSCLLEHEVWLCRGRSKLIHLKCSVPPLNAAGLLVQAEAVIAAAQQAATLLAQQQDTVKPDVAVAILQRLGRLRTPEASAKLQVHRPSYARLAGEDRCLAHSGAGAQVAF